MNDSSNDDSALKKLNVGLHRFIWKVKKGQALLSLFRQSKTFLIQAKLNFCFNFKNLDNEIIFFRFVLRTSPEMGADQSKQLENTLFNLKFSAKSLVRESKKCEKAEKEEKAKLKKAIQKGNTEGARIYAENAIRNKNQVSQFGVFDMEIARNSQKLLFL